MIFSTTAVSFTRPNDTTAYTAGDLVANSTTAGSVTPLTFNIPYGKGVKLWGANLLKSTTTTTNATFKLHLYKDSPTCSNGDNGAWLTTCSGYQGSITIDASVNTFSDDGQAIGAVTSGPEYFLTDSDQLLYGLLTATAGYAPGAQEVFTIQLLGESSM